MTIISYFAAFLLAYMLGSIPSAVWIGRKFHGIDVREHGSHNAGTTNVIRVLGWKTGIPVLLIDVSKGWLAAMLPFFLNLAPEDPAHLTNLKILTGLTAVIGHIFPLCYSGAAELCKRERLLPISALLDTMAFTSRGVQRGHVKLMAGSELSDLAGSPDQ